MFDHATAVHLTKAIFGRLALLSRYQINNVTLQRGKATIKSAKDISNRITWIMDVWDMGEFYMQIQATVTDIQAKLSYRQDGQSSVS
jgi:hypothetical protein